MITTLKPTTGKPLDTTGAGASVAPTRATTSMAVPETRSHRPLPYAIGAMLGLLVVLALAVWAYLLVGNGNYSDVIDLTQALAL